MAYKMPYIIEDYRPTLYMLPALLFGISWKTLVLQCRCFHCMVHHRQTFFIQYRHDRDLILTINVSPMQFTTRTTGEISLLSLFVCYSRWNPELSLSFIIVVCRFNVKANCINGCILPK